ncbi:hypothetical protein BD413DRAFT_574967 [Trametes elegans]|nr:hypothetical protein BD413DRAFT_574967 [Trametes elegans]
MLYTRMKYVVRFNGQYSDCFYAPLEYSLAIQPRYPLEPVLLRLMLCSRRRRCLAGQYVDPIPRTGRRHPLDLPLPKGVADEAPHPHAVVPTQWPNQQRGKSNLLAFGPLPDSILPLTLQGEHLRLVQEFTYVGVTLRSTTRVRI